MIVLVCGGRTYRKSKVAFDSLDEIARRFPIELVIHGKGYRKIDDRMCGADWYADRWARTRGVPVRAFRALWNEHGEYNARAGFERNERMLKIGCPEMLVAFPGGAGTYDMTLRAARAGLPIIEIDRANKICWPLEEVLS